MQKRTFLKAALGGATMLGTGFVSVAEAATPAADPTIDVEAADYWAGVLAKYRHDNKVQDVMLVRYLGGRKATIQFFHKGVNDAWELLFESEGFVGKNGIDKEGEGDAKTPTGDFGILRAFGILPNPGTTLAYVDVAPTTYACDEKGPYYNTIIDAKTVTGHPCKGEEMFEYSPQYNYGIETDFNSERIYPKGSAIFLHCKGVKPYTGGCIAIDQVLMKRVLQIASPGMRIVVHRN